MTGIKTPYLSVIIKFISTNFFCQYQQIYYLSYFHTGLYEKQTGAFCLIIFERKYKIGGGGSA